MSTRLRIDSVSSLVTLPSPGSLGSESGHIRSCAVSQFKKTSKKRKRNEIVACVDGTTVNIFDTESSASISSHAVSPLIKFTSGPCSIFSSQKSDNTAARRTYAAVLDTSFGRQSSICCFEQTKSGREWSSTRKLSIPTNSSQPIMLIDAVKSPKDVYSEAPEYDVVVVYEDGTVQCLDSRIESTLWTRNIFTGINSKKRFESRLIRYAFMTTADVLQTILQDRQDVLWRMIPYGSRDQARLEHHTVLCTVCAGDSEMASEIILSAITPRKPVQSKFENPLHSLDVWTIPLIPDASASMVWSFNSLAGVVQVTTTKTLTSLRLTGNVAKIVSVMEHSFNSGSHLALSPSAVLATTELGYTVFDLKFGCILDQRALTARATPARKRKRATDDLTANPKPTFIHYYAKSHTVLALQGTEILVIHINLGSHKHKSGNTLLIDLIRNGVPTSAREQGESSLQGVTQQSVWLTQPEKLAELVTNGDVNKFDRLFAKDVDRQLKVVNKETNEVEWDFPNGKHPYIAHTLHRHKALFALRCIFKRETDTIALKTSSFRVQKPPTLTIRFFPPNVFHWLIWSNQLNTNLVQEALSQVPEPLNYITPVRPGDLVKAIARFDPFMKLLNNFVKNSVCLDLPDLVHIIKIMVQFPVESDIHTPQELLTNGEDHQMNGIVDSFIEGETANAIQTIEVAMRDLQNGIDDRDIAFHKALIRLNDFSNPQIVETFQEVLSQQDLLSLLQILKIQLTGGGWTSLYVDDKRNEFENSINDVNIISRLLSCAVDAIGINGWLTFSDSGSLVEPVEELLGSLTTEISATLEGVHEAKFMEATLNEFLRYCYQLQIAGGKRKQVPGSQVIVMDSVQPELPLALKPADHIALTRVTSGGIVKQRSKRDIGRQISMKVPKYSFERIRL